MIRTTVNSLSGGKSSSYIAANYPADYELFSIVCVDDPDCAPKDKAILRYANDKIAKYCAHHGEIIGTCEDPVIFRTMMDLEQFIGREIMWLRSISFDELIRIKMAIPNKHNRICTSVLKMQAIFEFCYKFMDMGVTKINKRRFKSRQNYWCRKPISMRVGYRYDEKERADEYTNYFELPLRSRLYGKQKQNKSTFYNWRKGDFVMIRDKIVHPRVQQFWKDKPVMFADDSNCQHCFWKPWQQKRINWEKNPAIMKWASKYETKHTFDDSHSLEAIRKMNLPDDFYAGVGSGCQAGFCTD